MFIISLDGRVLCSVCRREMPGGQAPRRCTACTGGQPPKPGLGDMVKATLSAVGITEARVSKAIGKPCGCGKRAAKLNELGHRYLGLPPGQSPAG